MSIVKRHFIVRGPLLEKALELKALNDNVNERHREWASRYGGDGAEPAYQGTSCVGVILAGDLPGWRRIGAIGAKHVLKPRAKGEASAAYKGLGALERGFDVADALKGTPFDTGPIIGEAPGQGLGIAFFRVVATIYAYANGERVLLVHVPCNPGAERFSTPPDCTELLPWEWEKWLHDEKQVASGERIAA